MFTGNNYGRSSILNYSSVQAQSQLYVVKVSIQTSNSSPKFHKTAEQSKKIDMCAKHNFLY